MYDGITDIGLFEHAGMASWVETWNITTSIKFVEVWPKNHAQSLYM